MRTGGPSQPLALLDAFLASNPSRARLLLQQVRRHAHGGAGEPQIHRLTAAAAAAALALLSAPGPLPWTSPGVKHALPRY